MTVENSMRLFFKGIKIDDRTEAYIIKRLQGVQKILKNISRIEVEIDLDKKKNKFRIEVMVKTPYQLYRAEEVTESVEGSIDLAVEDLRAQITKDKDRIKTLRLRGRRSIKKKTVLDAAARF